MSNLIQAAAEFATASRWRVFPTIDKKPPPGFKWQDGAKHAGDVANMPWEGANGFGVALPHGVVVVDLDTVDGSLDAARETLATYLDMPAREVLDQVEDGKVGWTVRTRNGGLHLYCYAAPGLTRQVKVGPHVDLRLGGAGYVVGPGSPGYTLKAGSIVPNRLVQFPFGGWPRLVR